MSRKHIETIDKIFAHPMATNIDWKKLSHTLEYYGAEVDISNNNRARISISGTEVAIGLPHRGHEIAAREELVKLRHFLQEVGLTPETAAFFHEK